MKKTIFKAIVAILAVGFMLPSCLGDNNTKVETQNAIAYINRTENGTIYAATTSASVTSSEIKNLDIGRFYYIDFKFTDKNGMAEQGIYNADYAYPSSMNSDPVMQSSQLTQRSEDYPTINREIYLTNFNVGLSSPTDFLDDKWLLKYSCNAYEEDYKKVDGKNNLELVAYVVSKNQFKSSTVEGEIPEKLKDNQVIVNVYLRRIVDRPISPNAELKSYAGEIAVNNRYIRIYLRGRLGSNITSEGAIGAIQFQYNEYAGEDKDPKVENKGSLSDSPDFFMILEP